MLVFVAAQLFREPLGRTYAPPRGFVIATMPRSASTTLVKELNAHPDIECHREALHTQRVYANFAKAEAWTAPRRDANRTRFLARLFQGFAGFKFFPRHLSRPEFETLARSNVRKIVLERRDVLAQYVSLLRGRVTRRWRREKSQAGQVTVDLDGFRRFAALHDSWYAMLRDAAARTKPDTWLFVTMEDLTTHATTLESIFEHLGVTPRSGITYDPYLAKNVTTADEIANFRALHGAFRSDPKVRDCLAASPLFSAMRRDWKRRRRNAERRL